MWDKSNNNNTGQLELALVPLSGPPTDQEPGLGQGQGFGLFMDQGPGLGGSFLYVDHPTQVISSLAPQPHIFTTLLTLLSLVARSHLLSLSLLTIPPSSTLLNSCHPPSYPPSYPLLTPLYPPLTPITPRLCHLFLTLLSTKKTSDCYWLWFAKYILCSSE